MLSLLHHSYCVGSSATWYDEKILWFFSLVLNIMRFVFSIYSFIFHFDSFCNFNSIKIFHKIKTIRFLFSLLHQSAQNILLNILWSEEFYSSIMYIMNNNKKKQIVTVKMWPKWKTTWPLYWEREKENRKIPFTQCKSSTLFFNINPCINLMIHSDSDLTKECKDLRINTTAENVVPKIGIARQQFNSIFFSNGTTLFIHCVYTKLISQLF